MKEEFKNRFLYLKFDCATRLRVNYLGLNIWFVDDQGLGVTRTLAVVDTKSRHTTSRELKEIIHIVLCDYNIPLANIICCVTDNATNMVKLVSMMNEDLQQNEEVESETEENETLPGTLDLQSLVPINCEHMRCAVHTLQLAIHDGLKNTASGVIAKLRNVAKEAQSPKIKEQLRRRSKKVALLDQETRWGSTYAMIDRLIELKSFIEEMADLGNKNFNLSSFEWEQAISLRDLLKKAHLITKSLQYENLTPGYFYRKWSGLKLFYQYHGSSLADAIGHSMQKREKELLSNGLLLAAVLSDVSNMGLLPPEHEIKGKETLINLVLRIKGLGDASVPDLEVSGSLSDLDSDEEIRAVRKKQKLNEGIKEPSVFNDSGEEDNINLTQPPTVTR